MNSHNSCKDRVQIKRDLRRVLQVLLPDINSCFIEMACYYIYPEPENKLNKKIKNDKEFLNQNKRFFLHESNKYSLFNLFDKSKNKRVQHLHDLSFHLQT